MANQADVRHIALAFPGVMEDQKEFKFYIPSQTKPKAFVWAWRERVHPKKAKVPNPEVVVIPTKSLMHKEALLATNPKIDFTETHYNNYPAVLVRLNKVSPEQLQEILEDALECAKQR
jgi:hypothetical protein